MAPSQPSRRHHPKCAPKQKASQKHEPSSGMRVKQRALHDPSTKPVVALAGVVVVGLAAVLPVVAVLPAAVLLSPPGMVKVVDTGGSVAIVVVIAAMGRQTSQASHCLAGSVVKQKGCSLPSGLRQKLLSSPEKGKLKGVRVCWWGDCDVHAWHCRPLTVRSTKPR